MSISNNFKDYLFKNWSNTIQQKIPNFYNPTTENEIIDIVNKSDNIRMLGSGHSWSNLFETSDALVSMEQFKTPISIDKSKMEVTLPSGMKLWEINQLLDENGLAFSNLGSIDEQSIAGAIATGTHGTGIQFSCLASQIQSLKLINGLGDKLLIDKNHADFNGALVNLGALGIVTEMTLKVCPAYQLHDITYTADFDEMIENLETLIYSNDHFKMWWLPPSKKWVLFKYRRTDESPNDTKWRKFYQDKLKSEWGYRLILKLGNMRNAWRTPLNKYLTWEYRGPLNRIEKSYKVFKVPKPPLHRETEWAFDIKDAKIILKAYQKEFSQSKYSFNFIQEIRFTKQDNFWLSPCYGRDSIWVGMYNINVKNYDADLIYFQNMAKDFKGRPHWGKEFNVNRDYLEMEYPKYNDFIHLRNQMDPHDKFRNPLIDKLFI